MSKSKAPAAKFDAGPALNKAIRQPMLVERITKSYTLIAQKVLESRSQRQIEESVAEFEKALKDLKAMAPTADIKDNYQLLEQLWDEFKALAKQAANPEKNKLLAEQNEEVVWISQKGANLLTDYTKSARSELISTAGDIRVLTQRIAKLYLFRSSGIRSQVGDPTHQFGKAFLSVGKALLLRLTLQSDQTGVKGELSDVDTNEYSLLGRVHRCPFNSTLRNSGCGNQATAPQDTVRG